MFGGRLGNYYSQISCVTGRYRRIDLSSSTTSQVIGKVYWLRAAVLVDLVGGIDREAYKGSAGRPFNTSPVPFLPNAGLALRLNEPLLRSVVAQGALRWTYDLDVESWLGDEEGVLSEVARCFREGHMVRGTTWGIQVCRLNKGTVSIGCGVELIFTENKGIRAQTQDVT